MIKRRNDLDKKSSEYALILNRLQAMEIDNTYSFDVHLHLQDIKHYKTAYKAIMDEIAYYDDLIKNHL